MSGEVTKNLRSTDFFWVGNRLSVDFVNTTPVLESEPVELLARPEDLWAWLTAAGLFTPQQVHGLGASASAEAFQQARFLRDTLREGFNAMASGRGFPVGKVEVLNSFARKPTAQVLAERAGKGWSLRQRWLLEDPGDAVRPIATDALELLASAGQVRHCANPKCVLFFLDTSKSQRRRWCSMAVCGNRAKVAEFRARENRR